MQEPAQAEAWLFAQFRLEPKRRVLLANGAVVALSSRAFDILEFLVENRDRVVTRDEIVAHVWRGVNVGENNLAVQLSGLRRALADHGGGEKLIVSLPGRGYRFAAEVTVLSPNCSPALGPAKSVIEVHGPPVMRWGGIGRRGLIVWGVGLMLAVSLVALEVFVSPIASHQEARLSIAAYRLKSIGGDPRTEILAARYTEELLAHFGIFEDLTVFPDLAVGDRGFTPHFQLTGSVRINGPDAALSAGVTETATGRLLYKNIFFVPVAASTAERFSVVMQLLSAIRPVLYKAEFARRQGAPRDALDLFIEAHVAFAGLQLRSQLGPALALAERATRLDPHYRPARVLLSLLLTDDMLATDARRGDAEGRRALSLIDNVLLEQPGNWLYIQRRAFTLRALGRLVEAEATAELGLPSAPNEFFMVQILGDILMQKGDLARARLLISPNPEDTTDDRLAALAFAERRYVDALSLSRAIIAAAPSDWDTQFTVLLEAATLSRLDRQGEARTLLRQAMNLLPQDFRRVSAQRQAYYVLPDDAWTCFKRGLAEAGMPP